MASTVHALVRPAQGPEGQEDMPYLLTPGPLTTSRGVKQAMLADWGSRDIEFRALIAEIRQRLLELAGAREGHECILMQGSGTFAIEAVLGSICAAPTLVVANGAYGDRAAKILKHLGRPVSVLDFGDSRRVTADAVAGFLDENKSIETVFVVHCETTSGIVNPITEIAACAKARGKTVIVDAMSSFGAIPLDMGRDGIDVMVSSSNKCIEGVPGFSYAICRRDLLEASKGRSHSVVLDLYDQWQSMEKTAQFRFTPPTHALVAFRQALKEHAAEGGVEGRGRRYRTNRDVLVAGMREMGFETLLSDAEGGPIIQTFLTPADPNFKFERFYDGLRSRGYAIYPGKLTKRDTFRIGTIGHLDVEVMRGALAAVRDVLNEMGVSSAAPVGAP